MESGPPCSLALLCSHALRDRLPLASSATASATARRSRMSVLHTGCAATGSWLHWYQTGTGSESPAQNRSRKHM